MSLLDIFNLIEREMFFFFGKYINRIYLYRNIKVPTPKSLMRTNSVMTPSIEYKRQLTRLESNKSKSHDYIKSDMQGI